MTFLLNRWTRRAAALVTMLCAPLVGSAEEPITFVLPAANFQPVAGDAYTPIVPPQTPPSVPAAESELTPPPAPPTQPTPIEPMVPEHFDGEASLPNDVYEPLPCPNCNGGPGGCESCGVYDERLPNGQIPDDWMWGCGGWPYANGPGTCDDWKVGPIWDVTVDGMVMTREATNLELLRERMFLNGTEPNDPEVIEQFDRGPGGRVYLTGLVPRNVGYQVMAGYEGIEEWNAAIVYDEVPPFPPFGTPSNRRSLYYRSSLHSGELNIIRMCNPALRPYCGVRYIKFDDEIWDESIDELVPPVTPPPADITDTDTLHIFDIENNLIGFQGGAKYDVWNWGRRFSLQGFVNGGVYYNRAKWSNVQEESQVFYGTDGSVVGSTNSSLTVVEESEIAYVGEASLTAVCRLNKCWACRAGYQVLHISGVQLASDAYVQADIDERSLIFHGWHAGIECRR
jgi:hypothetical protein